MAKIRPARGRLEGAEVIVDDEASANRLYNKGFAGRPLSGNRLALSLVEAAYAIERGRLVLHLDGGAGRRNRGPATVAELLVLGSQAGAADVEVGYLAYRDLRERGLVVREDPDEEGAFLLWDRGQSPPQPHARRLRALGERDPLLVGNLGDWVGDILCVVDEDGAVTHYLVESAQPEGTRPAGSLPRARGELLADRVVVEDAEAAAAWWTAEFLGTRQGDKLFLSLTEAASLMQRGVLSLGSTDFATLEAHARGRQHHYTRTKPVYEALRAAGVVAKSGFKFGAHLRGYRDDPDSVHAEWLVHASQPEDRLHWSEISRGVRLAHGVRKQFLVAIVQQGSVDLVGLSWYRP